MVFYYTHLNKKTNLCYFYYFKCSHGVKVYGCNICTRNIFKANCQHSKEWHQCELCSKSYEQKVLNSDCVLLRPKTESSTSTSNVPINPESSTSEKKSFIDSTMINMDTNNLLPQNLTESLTLEPSAQSSSLQDQSGWRIVTSKRKLWAADSPNKNYNPPKKVHRTQKAKRQLIFSASNSLRTFNSGTAVSGNQFQVLQPDQPEEIIQKTPSLPPPLFVSEEGNPIVFKKSVIDTLVNNSKIHVINKSQVKLVVQSKEDYTVLFEYFKNNNIKFHTYQQKDNRNIRRVIKGLSIDFPVETIKQVFELHENIIVKNLVQIRHPITKNLLPIFKIEFEPRPNISQTLKNIKIINDFIIKLEFPQKSSKVIQCKKCLSLGHSQNFCHRNFRCIVCGDFHKAESCPRKLEAIKTCTPVLPTCALCGGTHFGNYRGCKVYKEINKKRFPLPLKSHQNIQINNKVSPNISYARALSGTNNAPAPAPTSTPAPDPVTQYKGNDEVFNQFKFELLDRRLKILEETTLNQSKSITALTSAVNILTTQISVLISRLAEEEEE